MATGPNIGIYDTTNLALVSIWNVGIVKADVPSSVFTIYIWNNKGQSTPVSDLRDCYIGVYDADSNTYNTEVPLNRWVEINVPSVDGDDGETAPATATWTAIGGTVVKNIKATGMTNFDIAGADNDGSITNTSNFCKCNFRIKAPINSTPGSKDFNIRLTGYFT